MTLNLLPGPGGKAAKKAGKALGHAGSRFVEKNSGKAIARRLGAKPQKTNKRIFRKSGGAKAAKEDFKKLAAGHKVEKIDSQFAKKKFTVNTQYGKKTVVLREQSQDEKAVLTIDIQEKVDGDVARQVKIRYDPK